MDIQQKVIGLLCLLYFLQGLPQGIQIRSLPMYYYESLHVPIKTVTKIYLLMAPWFFLKPILICFVDLKKSFFQMIYFSVFANVFWHVSLYFIFSAKAQLSLIVVLPLVLINCFTVLLDAATDRLAIASASSVTDIRFFGVSNAIQIVAFKFGASCGVLIFQLFGYQKVREVFLCIGTVYFVSLCLVAYVFQTYSTQSKITVVEGVEEEPILVTVKGILSRTFAAKCNLIFILYILTYKLGDHGAVALYPLYLVELGVSRSYVTFFTSIISEPLSLLGSLLGGFVCALFKHRISTFVDILIFVGYLRAVPILAQCYALSPAFSSKNDGYVLETSMFSVPLLYFLSGMTTTFAFTVMMMISYVAGRYTYGAYCYAMLSSIEVLGKLSFSSFAGTLGGYMGKQYTFGVFCASIVANAVILCFFKFSVLREIEKKE